MCGEEETCVTRQTNSACLMPEIQRNDQPRLAMPALEPEHVPFDAACNIIADAQRAVLAPQPDQPAVERQERARIVTQRLDIAALIIRWHRQPRLAVAKTCIASRRPLQRRSIPVAAQA